MLRDELAQAAALCSSDDNDSELGSLQKFWAPGRAHTVVFSSRGELGEQVVHVSNLLGILRPRARSFVLHEPKPELSGTVYVSSVAWWQQTIRPRVDLLVHICTDAPGLLPRIEINHNNSSLRVFLATIKDV